MTARARIIAAAVILAGFAGFHYGAQQPQQGRAFIGEIEFHDAPEGYGPEGNRECEPWSDCALYGRGGYEIEPQPRKVKRI